ncbi:hypothetical protein HanXRQr2_Chr12g0543591 [Helianthus annuus]|uniref:Uncharacterized protein n=1 Tax=Helianthus annuus TaxID=4232 RepID=A0A251T294_HELAN|nr:hypothetical protein HanXRQr2_Chr12g0543591 [Helianthus annuus]KAJ0862865.1 hypothetical protein HanPSC8_Chr12g0523291 [Helianthus annuus]
MSTEEPSHRSSHRKRASLRIGESNTSPETRHPHGTRIFMSELEDDTAILTGSRARRRVATRIRLIALVRSLGFPHLYSCVFTRNRNAITVD